MANGNDTIIIRGGSTEVEFNTDTLVAEDLPAPHPKSRKKHKNDNKKITQIVITGDVSFDSRRHDDGLTCEITCLFEDA